MVFVLPDFVASPCFVRCEIDLPALEAKQFSLWLFLLLVFAGKDFLTTIGSDFG